MGSDRGGPIQSTSVKRKKGPRNKTNVNTPQKIDIELFSENVTVNLNVFCLFVYSTLEELLEMVNCLLNFHEIRDSLKKVEKPVIGFLVNTIGQSLYSFN